VTGPASRAPVRPGDLLAGKYVVERVLGVGGMGVVVAARHQLLGGRVALKFVLPELAQTTEVVQRFVREAQAATRITSEHVARVTDVGALENGAPFMVMEYLEGRDLGSLLDERGPLPVSQAVDYLLQGLQAVAEAHKHGIVHRDLKPSNLFLTQRPDGSALIKVLDFGIAKAVMPDALGSGGANALTGTQGMLGSPLYMSPEQIKSPKHVDARSDVWSAGVILFELLTRRHPFVAESAGAVLASILTEPPVRARDVRPDLPVAIEQAILACLEKGLERRTPTVGALARMLAPFGTEDARLSYSRISGISGDSATAFDTGAPSGTPSPIARSGAVAVSAPSPQTGGSWAGTHGSGAQRSEARGGRQHWLVLGLVATGVALGAGYAFLGPATSTALSTEPSAAEPAASPPLAPAAPPPIVAPVLATARELAAATASAAPTAGAVATASPPTVAPSPSATSATARSAGRKAAAAKPSPTAAAAPKPAPTVDKRAAPSPQHGGLDALIEDR
jgi:eukaryotic-like serine/threonine-protein kinase